MTPQPCFIPLSIKLRMLARQNERDVCCRYGAVHAFVAHWLRIADAFTAGTGNTPDQAAEMVLSQAQEDIAQNAGNRQAA